MRFKYRFQMAIKNGVFTTRKIRAQKPIYLFILDRRIYDDCDEAYIHGLQFKRAYYPATDFIREMEYASC